MPRKGTMHTDCSSVHLPCLQIHSNVELRELGWLQLLQIHDEIILEGPEENKERAMEIVLDCMQHPFGAGNSFLVDLTVDASFGYTWAQAK